MESGQRLEESEEESAQRFDGYSTRGQGRPSPLGRWGAVTRPPLKELPFEEVGASTLHSPLRSARGTAAPLEAEGFGSIDRETWGGGREREDWAATATASDTPRRGSQYERGEVASLSESRNTFDEGSEDDESRDDGLSWRNSGGDLGALQQSRTIVRSRPRIGARLACYAPMYLF